MAVNVETQTRPSRQPRSLATERKLTAAVIALLDRGGLEACTAPALAREASVAVGTIYARYQDKDALIRAALLQMTSLDRGARDGEVTALVDDAADLAGFLSGVAATALTVTREHRTLLMAVREFVRRSQDPAWRLQFLAQQGRARDVLLAAAIARFGSSVRGGAPALRMALTAIYGAVEVAWLDPAAGLFDTPPSPQAFVEALTEMQLRYLT
ncbi:MAG: TetR/AcrR family transcriptional regulator [Phenylobacterium sp.]